MAAPAAPHIFDRALLRLRLQRAARQGAADFLLAHAIEELGERLALVSRSFHDALDLGAPGPHAAALLASRGVARVTRIAPLVEAPDQGGWRSETADIEDYAPAPDQFDLIVSVLALQTVNDLPGVLTRTRRALKPDGLFLACLVGGASLNELRAAMTQAEVEIRDGASPRVAPFADVRDMGGLLQRAGFALPVADVEPLTLRYDHLFALARDLRAMGATNALATRDKRPLPRTVALRAAEIYAEKFADADGRVRATIELIWLSGWAPHESQQKPLAPGSARTSLAQVLPDRAPKTTRS